MMTTKVNTTETIRVENDEGYDQIAVNSGAMLAKASKVRMRIPKQPGQDDVVECCINGYVYLMRRGDTVELPEPVVELLCRAGIV